MLFQGGKRRNSAMSSISTNKRRKTAAESSAFNETVILSDSEDETQNKLPTMVSDFIFLNSVIFEYSRSDMKTLTDI
jgi:hypothetical protein